MLALPERYRGKTIIIWAGLDIYAIPGAHFSMKLLSDEIKEDFGSGAFLKLRAEEEDIVNFEIDVSFVDKAA